MARHTLAFAVLTTLLLPAFAEAQAPDANTEHGAPDTSADSAEETESAEEADSASGPRYLAAVRSELERLDLNASCEVLDALHARCSWRVLNSERTRDLTMRAVLDESTQTLYLYAPIATAHPDDAETNALLRRIAEINWRYLASKLEWNSSTGEVRISALQHLDTNFDRRAFRVLVRLLARQSLTTAAELRRLMPTE